GVPGFRGRGRGGAGRGAWQAATAGSLVGTHQLAGRRDVISPGAQAPAEARRTCGAGHGIGSPGVSPNLNSPAVEVSGLVKRYGATVAVNGLDLRVDRGSVLALLGPNGAGQTTTVEVRE